MTHFEQFIEMLRHAGEEHEVTQGTIVIVRDVEFIFHINGDLKDVHGIYEGIC